MERTETTASAPPLVLAWSPPAAFDEYRIVRLLGRGAMGQVHLAHDTLLDRLVAVKFIAIRVRDEDSWRERFLVEARAIARIHHPNVVMVHRVGEVDGQPYLVSEYVRGETLDALPKPLPGPRLSAIAVDLARGLAAVHRHGVLHRDIKPGNVIVAGDGTAKLLDFGLAKLIEASAPDPGRVSLPPQAAPLLSDATAAGTAAMVGTPLYMAPEIWQLSPATRRSDVFSVGALLYELAAGRLPHAGKSSAEIRAIVTSSALPPLGEAAPGIDPGFAAVVDRCVARDPGQRFESGDAVREALEAAATPVPARAGAVVPAVPYRGLRAFDAEHRAVFFGRDGDVRAVLDRLRTEGFVLVAGDSGVGKSSLVAAGVLPALADGALAPGVRFASVRAVPGRRPVASLAAVLAPVCGVEEAELARRLAAQPSELASLLRRRGAPVAVVVDQLEELVTVSDPGEAATAAEILGELANCGARDIRLLGTVRADFLGRVATLSRLGDELPRALYLLSPLSPAGLREAIVGPARALGCSFQSEATVDALVGAASGPGALPLLGFALAELWETRDAERRLIPAAALEAVGGLSGTLARHSDAVIAALSPADRVLARRVLSSLVTPEGTLARRTAGELAAADGGDAEHARGLLEALVRGRLLVARPGERGEEGTYQLAHETLVTTWGTLRSWLSNQAEARAVRGRLERAAAEWNRLGRPRGALWRKVQLAEAAPIEPARLAPREREFLRRSRAAARLRRVGAVVAIAALPLVAAAAYGGSRWLAHRARDREIAERLAEADAVMRRARDREVALESLRHRSFADFDAGRAERAEAEWAEVISGSGELESDFDRAQQGLERALLLDGERRDVRRRFAAALYEAALLAERDHRLARRDELLRRLRVHDVGGALQRRWEEPARLDIAATPNETRIAVQPYRNEGGQRRAGAPLASGTGALHELSLPPGSYLVTLVAPSRPEVRYPVVLERAERHRAAFAVPASVPAGFVYLPAGRFLVGSGDPEIVRQTILPAPPLHRVVTGAFLMQRTEVTMRQWIEFLRALPTDERESRRPRAQSPYGTLDLRDLGDGRWQLTLHRAGTSEADAYHAIEGERLHYRDRSLRADQDWLDFPVTGISWNDAVAYTEWLAATGRVPGARLCDEREWERAARGADDRLYPHGDRLAADDANVDVTYDRTKLAFGPDAVGVHPASDSPFGIADLAGNAWEWMRSVPDRGSPYYGGGSFFQDVLSARSSNRRRGDAEIRSVLIGLRVCADAGPPP
jgi:eukaryotic-like serine/threonine-protein kinase